MIHVILKTIQYVNLKGDVLPIRNIIYTTNSTPRLVTQEGLFLTANKDFIKVINNNEPKCSST